VPPDMCLERPRSVRATSWPQALCRRRSDTRCTGCGECCKQTEMLLSTGDVARLRKLGYRPNEFTVTGPDGLTRLRNLDGWCCFYDRQAAKCRVYDHRPVGCSTYPVIFSREEGVVLDELCPERDTVSRKELEAQGRIVVQHLTTILHEARLERNLCENPPARKSSGAQL